MDDALKAGTYSAGLLGKEDLARLQTALESAIAKVQALKDAEKAAQDQLDSLGADLQDQLDDANGNQQAIEDRRFQKQLADLAAAAKAAGALSSSQYQQDVANANALHALKMKQLAQQAAAQSAANGSSSGVSSSSSGSGASPSGPGASSGGGALPVGLQALHYHLADGSQATLYGDAANANKVWDSFVQEIQRARINSI